MRKNRLTTILGAGIASHVSHSLTAVDNSLMVVKNPDVKTIREIMEEERGIKITKAYNNYNNLSSLYDTPIKKRGSNFTPKKKKRKKK
jgi:hypothetical protein